MKKFLNLFVLVVCFSFLSSTVASAQSAIENKTACEYLVSVEYGTDDCDEVLGEVEVVVQPFSTLILPIPSSYVPLTAKGAYNTASLRNCPFVIGVDCSANPQSQSVSCILLCGDYTASIGNNVIVIEP